MRNKTMNVDEQVEYLRDVKGVTFLVVDENRAKAFLEEKNYFFKVKAFAKNYPKRPVVENDKGKYINLDFGYLIELSKLDKCLRDLVLQLTLDIEHYLKVRINSAAMNSGVNPYELTKEYFEAAERNVVEDQKNRFNINEAEKALDEMRIILNGVEASINESPTDIVDIANALTKSLSRITVGSDPEYARKSIIGMEGSAYSGDLVKKYQNAPLPFWCLMELMSFGQVISLYKTCFSKNGLIHDEEEAACCKRIKNLLRGAQGLRNAAAHGDCLLNSLSKHKKRSYFSGILRMLDEIGIDHDLASNVKSVQVAMDISSIFLCYDLLVPLGTSRNQAKTIIESTAERTILHRDWFEKNYDIKSFIDYFEHLSYVFLRKL